MTQWKEIRLSDHLSFITSGSRGWSEYYASDGALFLRIQNVGYNELRLEDIAFVQPPDGAEARRTRVQPGDVLLSITADLGRTAVVPEGLGTAHINQHLAILRVKDIDPHYLAAFLSLGPGRLQLQRLDRVGVKSGLNFDDVRSLRILLPPLPEQHRIAAILDKADAVRRKSVEAISLADDFLKSAFLNMFGDPVTNPKGWPEGTINDVVSVPQDDIRCGPFGTQLKVHELVTEGIPLLGIENVHNDKFISVTSKYITPAKSEELKRFDVKPGDVLVTRMGTIGRACVVPRGIGEARISYHLFRIRPDEKKCLSAFLAATICRSGVFQHRLSSLAHGAIMSGLNISILREIRFLLPPVKEQTKYVELVSQTESLISRCRQSSLASEILFNSLVHRAFRGEL